MSNETTAAAVSREGVQAVTGMGAMVQVAFWLVVVVAVIVASAWLLRRVGGQHFAGGSNMRVLSTLAVGSRDRIALVQVGQQQLLIGVSPGRINTLHVFDEPVISDSDSGPGRPSSGGDFGSRLQSMMKGKS